MSTAKTNTASFAIASPIYLPYSKSLGYELGLRKWLWGITSRVGANYRTRWNLLKVLSSFLCTSYATHEEKHKAYARMREEMKVCNTKRGVRIGDILPEKFKVVPVTNFSHAELTENLFVRVHFKNKKVTNMGQINHARESVPLFFDYYKDVPREDLAAIVIAYDNMLPDSGNFWSPLETHILARKAKEAGFSCAETFSGPYNSGNFLHPEDGKVYEKVMFAHPSCNALPEFAGRFPQGLCALDAPRLFLKMDPPYIENVVHETIKQLVEFLEARPEGTETQAALAIPQYNDLYEDENSTGKYFSRLDYDITLADKSTISNFGECRDKEIRIRSYIVHVKGLLPEGQTRKWDAEEPEGSRDENGKWIPYIDRPQRR